MKMRVMTAWILVLAMLVSFVPGFAVEAKAAEPTVLESSTKENANQSGGIVYTKTSTAKSDGTVDIELSAYTTGTVTNTTTVKPVDIVLVLDLSGSMDDNYSSSNRTPKIDMLKEAVNAFIDSTAEKNADQADGQKHAISIIKFAGSRFASETNGVPSIAEGNDTYRSNGYTYNYTQVVKQLTTVDAAGVTALKDAVADLEPNGATAVDKGLLLADTLLNANQGTDRDEVVIVFTDGDPNHLNGFDDDVADAAIASAKALKDSGVTVYGVCIASGANASNTTSDTNKFMHYITSNYPDAESMSSGGTRAADSNFYLTTSSTTSLVDIFQAISSGIVHSPVITLGQEASVVDTLSPYFDFQNAAPEGVQLMVSDRLSDGTWAAPVLASEAGITLTPVFQNDKLTVEGFDFDANHISDQGRGDNGDFYGRKLVIKFTVVPDYEAIDNAGVDFPGGILPTNTGFALLNDSADSSAAEVATPELTTHQVIYKVDGQEYASYNRFTGASVTVDAVPTKEGYTFSGWTMNGESIAPGDGFTMPNGDVEIVGTFTVNNYQVTYQYSGNAPDGAPELPAPSTAAYGATVTVADIPELQGYVFVGWDPLQMDVEVSDDNTFTMPAKDVTLVGHFDSATNTPYTVEHYLETLEDGVYEEEPVLRETGFTGTTGHTVTATPLSRFTGFTYNAEKSADTISGEILPDGSLVLKIYYDRNTYQVTYSFTGDIPVPQPQLPATAEYKYGETVTVAQNASAPGYTFSGWESLATEAGSGEQFTMPAQNVAFIGEFSANSDTQYKVEYYLQNIDNDEYTLNEAASYTDVATTGTTVYATSKEFAGFTFDAANPNNLTSGTVAGDGSLVLKLYYNRNVYSVTYAYEGSQPAGAPALPTDGNAYRYGATVTVQPDLTLEGYTFAGWHSSGHSVGDDTATFVMPDRDVTLYGSFEPADGTAWREEHYFEDLEGGTYTLKYEFDHTGTTGETASAAPIAEEPGFRYDADHPETVTSATIAPDGSTVLKFYYVRESYTVTYIYDPAEQPAGAPALPAAATYKFGQTVTVEPALTLTGYTFIGWHPQQSGVPGSGTFPMPAGNVVFEGDFDARSDTKYEVHHHLMLADGTYPASPDYVNEHTGTTGATVPAIPRNFDGYVLNTEKSQMEGVVLADGSLVLDLFYDRIQYNVTYSYEGHIPEDAPELPAAAAYMHGEFVPVAGQPVAPAGHTFIGWYRGTEDNPVSDEFEMPMHDVHLLGRFVHNTDTPYKVEHYLQNVELTGYDLDSEETRHGTTEETVSALPREYPGFTYNSEISNPSGEIAGDGSLVLKFFYDRNTHKVTYGYEGAVPEGAPEAPAEETGIPYGREMAVAAAPAVPGYTFSGWTTADASVTEGKYTMPDADVAFYGRFTANDVTYRAEYWLQNLDGSGYTEATDFGYERTAKVGDHVEADRISFPGFTYNAAHPDSKPYGHVSVDEQGNGNLVLKIYLDRLSANVTYRYAGPQPENAPDLTGLGREQVPYGTEMTVEELPVLEGYVFEGWYTHTASVTDGKYTMPEHDVEFYGSFAKYYTVSYDLAGGTGAEDCDYSDSTVKAGTVIDVLEAPTKAGHTFTGWLETETAYAPFDTVTVERDMHFVAQWQPNSVATYTLTYVSNGGTEYEPEVYNEGTQVSITKKPVKEDHVFEGWYADEALTKPVKEVTMDRDITVYAKWVEDNGSAGNGHETPDPLNGEDHFAYVVGYPDGNVKPGANITRAEVTTIFFRLLKPDEVRDKNLTSDNSFTDILETDWYNTAISTMAKLGIVNGRTAEYFDPNANITRAEFATICARFDDSDYEIADNFVDIQGHWAESYIHEAAAHGWIRGYEDGTFRPDQLITRAEAMIMINRVLNRVPEGPADLLEDMTVWPDNSDPSAWYYLAVQEATNSHEYEMKNSIYETWTKLKENKDWTQYE